MSLHLVRVGLDLRALATYAVASGVSDDDGGYAVHAALRARFGAAAPQPFRVFAEHRRGPHVLGYASDRQALADAAALPVADPLLGAVFAGAPDLQPMPNWRDGARYGFAVRVRPVVRYGSRIQAERAGSERARAADAWWARAGEVDAYVAAWAKRDAADTLSREGVYAAWLAERVGAAATLESAELRSFRRVRSRRSSHGAPGRKQVEGPDALIAGTLAVADAAAFAALLARGVGRHAAFGYGMLLLSPPGRG